MFFVQSSLRFLLAAAVVALGSFSQAAQVYEVMAELQRAPSGGGDTPDGLVLAEDGNFYGLSYGGGGSTYGTLYQVSLAGALKVMVNLTGTTGDAIGRAPLGGMVRDGTGHLWGATSQGGAANLGTIFKYHVATGTFTTVTQFTGTGGAVPGSSPYGNMCLDGTGFIWGVTQAGGATNRGTVFKVNLATGAYVKVAEFTHTGGVVKGSSPRAGLILDGSGFIWGTTQTGGTPNAGTVFKINAATGAFTTVHEFPSTGSTPRSPQSPLVRDGTGFLWGTSVDGGTSNFGTVYKVNATSGAVTTVIQFTGTGGAARGSDPYAALVSDGAGNFWGSTYLGGVNNAGTVFKLNATTGVLTTVAQFSGTYTGNPLGNGPKAALASDGAGNFWGVNSSDFASITGAIFKTNIATGATTTVLDFTDAGTGHYSYSELESDASGAIWGSTRSGPGTGRGTNFRFTPETRQLQTFPFNGGSTGALVGSSTVSDGLGFRWGVAAPQVSGGGFVYKLNPATGAMTTVKTFATGTGSPQTLLVHDGAGFMWGGTVGENLGTPTTSTLYKINRSTGAFTTVHTFPVDGPGTFATYTRYALTNDGAGFLWGTTITGGVNNTGTIFKVNIATGAHTTVFNFPPFNSGQGMNPGGSVTSDGGNFFWGVTKEGGAGGAGTIYKWDKTTGVLTTVAEFRGQFDIPRGDDPTCTLTRDAAGNFWGTTVNGGASDMGTIFKVSPAGQFTTIAEFTGNAGVTPGYEPRGGRLIFHTDGHLYGTTTEGGPGDGGVIFRIRFGPVAETLAASDVTPRGATLRGTIDPNGVATTAAFHFGTNAQLTGATAIPLEPVDAGADETLREFDIGGLTPNTTYYYRTVATTAQNPVPQLAPIRSFTTLPLTPPIGGTMQPIAAAPVAAGTLLTVELSGWTDAEGQIPLTYELLLDGAPLPNPGPSVQFSAPAQDGVHTLTGRVFDAFGAMAEVTRQFIVDAVAPVITGDFAPLAVATGANGMAVLPDYIAQAAATDAVGVVSLAQVPAAGTLHATGTITVTLTALDAVGNAGTRMFEVSIVDGTQPQISAPAGGFTPMLIVAGSDGRAALPSYTSQAVTSDNVGVAGVVQSPPAGSILPFGRHTVTLTAADAVGNISSIDFTVAIGLDAPLVESLSATGQAVPGAGIDPRIGADATFTQLGLPAVSDDRSLAFLASWKSNRRVQHGIFQGVEPALVVATGEETPGIAGGRFRALQHPLIAPDGSIAFRATAAGRGIHAGNDQGIWLRSAAGLQLVLREGAQIAGLPAAHVLHSVAGVSLRNGELLAMARLALRGNVARNNNDTVLIRLSPAGATIVAREGALLDLQDGFPAAKVKSLRSLVPVSGSPAHGRWHAGGAALVHVTLENERPVVLEIGNDGTVRRSLAMADGIPNLPDSAFWLVLESPAIAPGGHAAAIRGSLTALELPGLPPVVDDRNDTILAYSAGSSDEFAMIAREGSDAPDANGAWFSTFQEPVVNDAGSVLFGATLAGLKTTAVNSAGLWWGPLPDLRLLARGNGLVPGPDGESTEARWSRFTSYALSSGPAGGPIFTAIVRGPGVTTRNNRGIWGVDSTGALRQLLRAGDLVNGKSVLAIQALNSAAGTLGSSRGYNARGTIAARVQLAGGGIALVRIDIPDGVPPLTETAQ